MIIEPQRVARPYAMRARYLVFLVPLLCFGASVWLRPAGRLGPPEQAQWLDQFIYDDYDFGAYALRGLNHVLGRRAGNSEAPKQLLEEDYTDSLRESRPLSETYYLEYPHAALLLFQVPYLFAPVAARPPPGLLDGAHEDLVQHQPSDDEAGLWQQFHRAATSYMAMMVAFHAALVIVLAVGYGTNGLVYRGLLLFLPGALFFSLNRFDIVPALLMAVSFACLGRGKVSASAVFLAMGTLVKVYPIFLAPLIVRYLLSAKNSRAATLWALTYVAAMAAFLVPAVVARGTSEIAAPYIVQLSRKHESLTAYLYLIPAKDLREELAGNGPVGRIFRLGSLGLTMALLLIRPIPDLSGVLRRGAVVLIVFINLSVFFSPQWILWLTPLLLPLAGRERRLIPIIAALDLLTWSQWPVAWNVAQALDWEPYTRDVLLTLLAWARLAVLALIVWKMLRADRIAAPVPQIVVPAMA
jgi:hypothetical protein